jgi:hypothetical protein
MFVAILVLSWRIGKYTEAINKEQPKIDLPEEWKAITPDKTKPDTLTCYKSGDSLYFQFK